MHNLLLFSWDRSLPGREQLSSQHFQDFVGYLQSQQAAGNIASFEPVFLEPHGSGMHGFFLIKGASAKLGALTESADWIRHMMRATLHLKDASLCRGVDGTVVGERMAMWNQLLPK